MLKSFVVLAIILACEAMPLADSGTGENGPQIEFTTCVTPAHYCMIADSSKSIFTRGNGSKRGDELWNKEKEVIRDIVAGFDIGPGPEKSKVALVKFGGQVEREFNLSSFTDKNATLEAINATKKLTGDAGQGTVTPEAIQECLDIFKEQEQTSVPKVIMVFSDGVTHFPSNHKFYNKTLETQKLKEAVNQSTTYGTINYAVMFVQSSPEKQLQAMNESLIIAQEKKERAFVNDTLEALVPTLKKELVCECTVEVNGTNSTYGAGDTIESKNPCEQCKCTANDKVTCNDISGTCPPPPSCPPGTNYEAVNVTGQCCPNYTACTKSGFCTPTSPCQNGGTCDETTDTCMCPTGYSGDLCDEFCMDNGTPYAVGDSVPSTDPCMMCTCVGHQNITCTDLCQNGGTCDKLTNTCNCAVGFSGDLCNEIAGCKYNGANYAVGDTVPSDSRCTQLMCASHDNITRTTTVCPQLDCATPYQAPGVCCPRCPDPCEPTHYCLVLDSSRSIFETDKKPPYSRSMDLWRKEKDVAHKVVEGLAIGPSESNSKVALVTYAASVKREFTFQQNIKKAFLLTAIHVLDPLPYMAGEGKGGTATPEAIKECLAIFHEESRPDMPKKIVVFTDGRTHYYDYINTPELSQARLVGAVKEATDAGVTNYAVVFRSDSDQDKAMQEATIIAQNVTKHRFYGETPSKITSVLHCHESEE